MNASAAELILTSRIPGSRELPWDLRIFLYRGGAKCKRKDFPKRLQKGAFGGPIEARLPLVVKIHEVLAGALSGGGSWFTAKGMLYCTLRFFRWIEEKKLHVDLSTVSSCYVDWTEHLIGRQRLRSITPRTAYEFASAVGTILDRALNLRPGASIDSTRVRCGHKSKRALEAKADKQILTDTFLFGSTLFAVSSGLTADAIEGPLPVTLSLPTGKRLVLWSTLRELKLVKTLTTANYPKNKVARSQKLRANVQSNASRSVRFPLINLRVEAELLIFVSQTGMNWAQARSLRFGKFVYQSHFDGYQVRRLYKNRRKGEVEFEIFSEYRAHLERYLQWRGHFFPDNPDGVLFPFLDGDALSRNINRTCHGVRRVSKLIDIDFVGPRALRNTRVNWFLRKSRDPELTAEMAQHSLETLITTYERPNLQVTAIEVSAFFAASDPHIAAPGPCACIEPIPEPATNIPEGAPEPDCISPAGCLFCSKHRDIDSTDHVWSLCSYRYLKSLELARYRPSEVSVKAHPAKMAMDRIDLKISAFRNSSETRRAWVTEALARVAEGEYHPQWDGFISLAELNG